MAISIRKTMKATVYRPDAPVILACKACKRPMFHVELLGGVVRGVTSFNGVGPYSDYWKDLQPIKTSCPFCGRSHSNAVQLPDGTYAAVPHVLETF